MYDHHKAAAGFGLQVVMQMIKNKLVMFITGICIICNIMLLQTSYVYASDVNNEKLESNSNFEDEMSELNIYVNYTDNIVPQENDIFEIGYEIMGSDVVAYIEIDAASLVNAMGVTDMDIASYKIVSITYKGSNKDITSYAVENSFSVPKNGIAQITITIGESGVSALDPDFIVTSESADNYNTPEPDNPSSQYEESENTEEEITSSKEDDPTENSKTEEKSAPSEEKSYKQVKSNPLKRLLPLVIISIIAFIVVFALEKKGKFKW